MGITDIRDWVGMLEFYQDVMLRVFMTMAQGQSPNPPLVTPPPVRDSQLLSGYLDRAIAQGHLRSCDTIAIAHKIVGAITNYVVTQNVANKLPVALPLPKIHQSEPTTFIHNLIETL